MAAPQLHLFPENDQIASRIGRAFGHPARIKILRLLTKSNEVSFSLISDTLPLSRQTVYQHLEYLMESGLVEGREDPPYTFYRLAPSSCRNLLYQFSGTLNVFLAEL